MAGAVALLGWGLGMLTSLPVRWHWEPAEGCPDEAAVVAHTKVLLGPEATDTPVEASGRVTGRPGAYTLDLHIEVGDQHERRQLQASDCELLTGAAVLVVAITIDALATADAVPPIDAPIQLLPMVEVPPPELPSAPPARAPPPRSTERPPPSVPSPETRTTALRVGLGAGLGWGLTPSGTAGIEGIVGGQLGALRLEAAGYHWFSQPTSLPSGTGTESAVSGGWLHGCVAWSWTAIDIPLCVGIDLAAMHGRGIGARVQPQEVRDLWVALSAGPGLEFRPSRRLALGARVEPFFAIRRPAMFLIVDAQAQETFRMPSFGLRVVLGPFFRLASRETGAGGAR